MKIKQRNNLGRYIKNGSYQRIGYGIGYLILLTLLLAFSAYYSASKPLVDPRASITVPQVYASEVREIPKEQTRWYRLYKYVRWVESNNGTKGLASTCRSKGMFNDIGFDPFKKFCFKTLEDQELTFANWVNKRYNNGLTESQLLCLWNTGIPFDSCAYSRGDLINSK